MAPRKHIRLELSYEELMILKRDINLDDEESELAESLYCKIVGAMAKLDPERYKRDPYGSIQN